MLPSFARELEKIAMGKAPSIPVSRASTIFGSKSGAGVPAAQAVSVKPKLGTQPQNPVALSGANAGRRSGAAPQATTVPQFDHPNTQLR